MRTAAEARLSEPAKRDVGAGGIRRTGRMQRGSRGDPGETVIIRGRPVKGIVLVDLDNQR